MAVARRRVNDDPMKPMSLPPPPLLPPDDPPLRLGGMAAAPQPRRRRTYALPWGIALAAMLVLATASWVFSLYVFGHPENPRSHAILLKLGRIDPPKRFDPFDVPPGKGLGARDLYAKYRRFASLTPAEIRDLNDRLLREFVTNYRRADPVDFISGVFRIKSVHPMGPATLMPAGLVLRAVSVEIDDLEIEYLMSGAEALADQFRPGDDLVIEATAAFGAVLRFEAIERNRLLVTIVPLVYGTHSTPAGGRIRLAPPDALNLATTWPQSRATGETAGK
jgi:hypothetical protein